MKKNVFTALLKPILLSIAIMLIYTSCTEEETPAPVASFSYEKAGLEVKFTNTSTNATTYTWNFGDGETSTEQSPTHTYPKYGKYTATLSVTGEGGTATSLPDEITLAKTSDIEIDGDMADWADIDPIVTSVDGNGGSMNKIKVDYDGDYIYFYVEGTTNLRGFFDVYMDADNDTTTGYKSAWYKGFGADYLSEGDFSGVNDADLFKDLPAGEQTVWGWEVAAATGSGFIVSSDLVSVAGGKAIEFSFLRATLTNLSDEKFNFAIVDVDGTVDPTQTVTWAKLGSLPVDNTPESKLVTLDLTK